MNICVDCKWFRTESRPLEARALICTHPANERGEGTDPVTGEVGYEIHKEGKRVLVPWKHRHARDCNDGSCGLYEAK